jgi:PIN domain nuclease of toxin-antitoxin system
MKLQLDTHAFIWWDSDPSRFSTRALLLCQDEDSDLLLSVASVWEMQIKLQLGKLRLERPLAELVEAQRRANGVEVLPIQLEHVLALEQLPAHHKHPFDRLLLAQALVENLVIVSGDPMLASYPATIAWQATRW